MTKDIIGLIVIVALILLIAARRWYRSQQIRNALRIRTPDKLASLQRLTRKRAKTKQDEQ